MLSDRQIRSHLARYVENRLPENGLLKHEQVFHNGNVIADLTAISKSFHLYEIKGDLDKISRLQVQSIYYNKVAPKITLVTTERNVEKAINSLPDYWGVLLARKMPDRIIFTHIRAASTNVDFSKYHALLALWKNELLDIAMRIEGAEIKTRHTREDLAEIIANHENKRSVISEISNALTKRYAHNAPELISLRTNSI